MVVLKFGGNTLSSLTKIKEVAKHIAKRRKKGEKICVVVSAMGDMTDKLFRTATALQRRPPSRELAMLLTAGERISIALLAIALNKEGIPAISFTGSQVGIITDTDHTDARIYEIRGERLKKALKDNLLPIVAGFQGVSERKEITTLGRGGSDITAVALAYFLNADRCEFYKDVGGVYPEDPKEFPRLSRIEELSYEEGLELTASGSTILHPRALALAQKYNVKIFVSSLKNSKREMKGTLIREKKEFEKAFVKAIAHQFDLIRFTFLSVPKVSRCLSQVVAELAQNRIPLLFFSHGVPHHNQFDLSFILKEREAKKAENVLNHLKKRIRAEKLEKKTGIGSISLIGPNVGFDPEILKMTFDRLQRERIHIDAFISSATNLTLYLKKEDVKRGVKKLLKEFHLQKK